MLTTSQQFERSWRLIETSSQSRKTRDVAESASCFYSWDRPFHFLFSSFCWSLWLCHELLTPCLVPFVSENASRFNFCSRCSLFLSSRGPASSGDGRMPKNLRCRRDKNTRKLIHNLDFLKSLSVEFLAFSNLSLDKDDELKGSQQWSELFSVFEISRMSIN